MTKMSSFIINRAFLVTCMLVIPAIADQWAVIVAGSSGWENLRHQSDIYHAYQILHRHGIPDDHIIAMFYDDLALNPENPFPGVIINRPNGPNVYPGVPKDYIGDNVTVANFLGVLRGTAPNPMKVLQSGPNDDVFIYLADHGGPGVFCFPNCAELLTAEELYDALYWLYNNSRYHQLVIYIEACESGSMFDGRRVNNLTLAEMNIYATSASTPTQPSYACYYDSTWETYLGDCYSVNWLQDSDAANMSSETLARQFWNVRNETTTSTVCRYGNLSISREPLSDFQGQSECVGSQCRTDSPKSHQRKDFRSAVRSDRVSVMRDLLRLEEEINRNVLDIRMEKVLQWYRHLGSEIRQIQEVQTKYPLCPAAQTGNPCYSSHSSHSSHSSPGSPGSHSSPGSHQSHGSDTSKRFTNAIKTHRGSWNPYEFEVLRYI
jgi:glycosylphosphatidylinositol transamidase (GPIT) subunit GPI8